MALTVWCESCEKPYNLSELNTTVRMSMKGVTNSIIYSINSWCPRCQERQLVIIPEKSASRDAENDRLLSELLEKRRRSYGKLIPPKRKPPESFDEPPAFDPPFAHAMADILQHEGCLPGEADAVDEDPLAPGLEIKGGPPSGIIKKY